MIRDVNAHIGLIQTGLISGSKLDFQISDEGRDDKFFRITAKVIKESA
jgi:hypothetical protein